MALAITHLIDGTITSNGGSTGTITATAGARVLITVGGAGTSENSPTNCAISGGGVTWAIVAERETWAFRRSLYVLMSSGTPSSGTVTIILTTGGFEQIKYSVDEITGHNNTTPFGTAYTYSGAGVTSAPATVSETPDAGDMVFYAAGLEDNNTPSLGAELDTTLVSFGDTTGCRRLIVAYDSAPDSTPVPSVTWSPACSTGAVAFIINAAAGGSASASPSASASGSPSASASASPSGSASASPSASESPSPSASESPSPSASVSPSPSASVSPSPSASASGSPSASASAPAYIEGEACWGHVTGVLEANVQTFSGNWTGTGVISGAGDAETIDFDAEGEYMESEIVDTGSVNVTLLANVYAAGDSCAIKYRTGATPEACEAAGWSAYTVPFASSGFAQVRIETP